MWDICEGSPTKSLLVSCHNTDRQHIKWNTNSTSTLVAQVTKVAMGNKVARLPRLPWLPMLLIVIICLQNSLTLWPNFVLFLDSSYFYRSYKWLLRDYWIIANPKRVVTMWFCFTVSSAVKCSMFFDFFSMPIASFWRTRWEVEKWNTTSEY